MNKFSYVEEIEKEYGKGVKPRGLADVEKRIVEKKEKAKRWAERCLRDGKRYKKNPHDKSIIADVEESSQGFKAAKENLEEEERALLSGDVFGNNTPTETIGLIPCDGDLSLADIYDIRFETDSKTARVVVENYLDTTMAGVGSEGDEIPTARIGDHLTTVKTDRESIEQVANILNVPERMMNDEKELLNSAIDSVQEKFIKNTETKILCDLIRSSKEPISLDSTTLFSIINDHLGGKAKREAEIITNDSGFAKLDTTDSNGNPLMRRDFNINEYILADRYIVRVVSDDILKNDENSNSPVFIGDWRNILRLAIVKRYPPLEKHDNKSYKPFL